MHALHVQICTKTTYKYILSHLWPLFQCFLHVQICFLSLQIQAVTMPDVGCQSSPSQALKSREIGQASARGRAHFTGGSSTVCRKNRGPSVLHCAFNLLLELSMLQSPEEPTQLPQFAGLKPYLICSFAGTWKLSPSASAVSQFMVVLTEKILNQIGSQESHILEKWKLHRLHKHILNQRLAIDLPIVDSSWPIINYRHRGMIMIDKRLGGNKTCGYDTDKSIFTENHRKNGTVHSNMLNSSEF